eukprot:1813982-Amphidinium_carterae.1
MAEYNWRDHEALPPKRIALQREVHSGPRNRIKRKHWTPPDWLRRLAEQAPERMLRRRRIVRDLTVPATAHTRDWHSMEHCGYNHARREYAILNGTTGQIPSEGLHWASPAL